MGIDHRTAARILATYDETGDVEEKSGRGRKRKIGKKDEYNMVKRAKKGKPATELARAYGVKHGGSVHVDTIRRILHRHGFFYLTVQKIEALSEDAKADRLAYALKMSNYNWNKVIFSDEKTFQLGSGQSHSWQQKGKRISRTYTRHPKKLHVWAGAGYYFKTKLYFFTENLKSPLYQRILQLRLKEKRIIYAADCPMKYKGNWWFLQDNDPKHRTDKSLSVIEDLVGENFVSHPSYSPDLNVQEDLWSYLNAKVQAAKITSIAQLKRKLSKEWEALPWNVIRTSVRSMPARMQECVKVQGARTHY